MSRLPDLRKSKNLRDVREWLGLSLSQTASEIPKTRGKGHVSRAFVCLVQRGQFDLLPAQMESLIHLIKQQLLGESRRDDIAIQIVRNSPWHVKVATKCAKCGKSFELKRITSRRCPRCARKGTTKTKGNKR